jgi:hypothetical protein
MGGRLKIEAVFSEGEVEINQFRKLKKTGGRIEGGPVRARLRGWVYLIVLRDKCFAPWHLLDVYRNFDEFVILIR